MRTVVESAQQYSNSCKRQPAVGCHSHTVISKTNQPTRAGSCSITIRKYTRKSLHPLPVSSAACHQVQKADPWRA